MKFDYLATEPEFETLRPRAQALALWLDRYSLLKHGKEITVTCIREGHRPGGPHHEGRAFDVRCAHGYYTEAAIADIVAAVNEGFHRWDKGPSCIHHDTGSGDHLHLVVEG